MVTAEGLPSGTKGFSHLQFETPSYQSFGTSSSAVSAKPCPATARTTWCWGSAEVQLPRPYSAGTWCLLQQSLNPTWTGTRYMEPHHRLDVCSRESSSQWWEIWTQKSKEKKINSRWWKIFNMGFMSLEVREWFDKYQQVTVESQELELNFSASEQICLNHRLVWTSLYST